MIVEIAKVDGYAEIILNHPASRNAITGPLGRALAKSLRDAAADESSKCILLRGAEGAFCSGLNLKKFNADPEPEWLPVFGKIWRETHKALYDCPKPIVVALEKYAINGGAALALAADILIVGDDSYLQVGEVRQGMVAPYNMAWIRLRFSESVASQLAIPGRRFTGSELASKGIAYLAPATVDTLSEARELCKELASFPDTALQGIKTSTRAYRTHNADDWFDKATASTPNVRRKPQKVIGG